jgi:L-ascorbate metabolism protein UlaG (beta-lactamase superfamily)
VFEWAELGDVVYVLENGCEAVSESLKIGEGEELSIFDGTVHIRAYGSTDEGVSFLVRVDGVTLFHAGDLNDWHWDGEMSEGELTEMEENYLSVLRELAGEKIDVAFIPVDPRLGAHEGRGLLGFEKIVGAKKIVPMHFPGNAGMEY